MPSFLILPDYYRHVFSIRINYSTYFSILVTKFVSSLNKQIITFIFYYFYYSYSTFTLFGSCFLKILINKKIRQLYCHEKSQNFCKYLKLSKCADYNRIFIKNSEFQNIRKNFLAIPKKINPVMLSMPTLEKS